MLLAALSSAKAEDKVECLSRVAYAEAKGEPVEGITVLMFAALRHAELSNKSVCHIPAKKQTVPTELKGIYRVLAKGVLSGEIKDTSKGSDSWRSTKDVPKTGSITRKINKHWFLSVLDRKK